jgi:hypothetical protein
MSLCDVCGNNGPAMASTGNRKGKERPSFSSKTVRAASCDRIQSYTRSRNASHWQRQRQGSKPPQTTVRDQS